MTIQETDYKLELINRIEGLDALVVQLKNPDTLVLLKRKIAIAVSYYNREDYFALAIVVGDIKRKSIRNCRNPKYIAADRRLFGYLYDRAGEIESITSLASLHFK